MVALAALIYLFLVVQPSDIGLPGPDGGVSDGGEGKGGREGQKGAGKEECKKGEGGERKKGKGRERKGMERKLEREGKGKREGRESQLCHRASAERERMVGGEWGEWKVGRVQGGGKKGGEQGGGEKGREQECTSTGASHLGQKCSNMPAVTKVAVHAEISPSHVLLPRWLHIHLGGHETGRT